MESTTDVMNDQLFASQPVEPERFRVRQQCPERVQTADWWCERDMIGIGGGLTAPPSHTTGHTGPYHGGSDELSVRRYRHSVALLAPGFWLLASPRTIRHLVEHASGLHPPVRS